MNYKKKYEEALERAKELHEAGNALTKSQMEIVFPELKESEDERIRKWLIEEIKATHDYDSPTSKKCVDDALAYLEKQKEKKPAEWSEEDENALEFLHELISFGFTEKFFDAQTAADMRKWLNTRLKSLRPQPNTVSVENATQFGNLEYERGVKDGIQSEKSRHWKPSEEQLSILGKVFAGCELNTTERDSMVDLFYNLKQML